MIPDRLITERAELEAEIALLKGKLAEARNVAREFRAPLSMFAPQYDFIQQMIIEYDYDWLSRGKENEPPLYEKLEEARLAKQLLEAKQEIDSLRQQIAEKQDTISECSRMIHDLEATLVSLNTKECWMQCNVCDSPKFHIIWEKRIEQPWHCPFCGCETRYEDMEKETEE